MADLNEIFQRIRKKKKEGKKIKDSYKDALKSSKSFQETLELLQQLTQKKKQIEQAIRSDFEKDFENLERIDKDVKDDQQLLTDKAITNLTHGQTVEVTDENDTKYEPVFKVNFKKTN